MKTTRMPPIGTKGAKRLLLALSLLVYASLPAHASPSLVTNVRYDEAHRTFSIESSGMPVVQTKRLINPDRLVIDLSDSTLRPGIIPGMAVSSRKIKGFRVAQFSQSPDIVRIVIELVPGLDPLVALNQSPGRVELTLGDPPQPTGEQDLETLPPTSVVPSATPAPIVLPTPGPVPTPVPVAPTSVPMVTSRTVPTSAAQPTPFPTPAPVWTPAAQTQVPESQPTPLAWPSPDASNVPPEFQPPTPRIPHPDPGFGSSVMLRWQQLEALDSYGATSPVFGYSTGLNGVELRHWFMPNVGFGLDSRVLTYDLAAEGVRENRTDLMVMPELVGRYPLFNGAIEPELFLGYMGRQVTVFSPQAGTSFPFSPSQFYHGFTAGGGGRIRLLPALSLGLAYQFLPAVGGNLFNDLGMQYGSIYPLFQTRFEVELMFDIKPAYLSIGYTDETSKNRSVGYTQTLTGILAGVGYRY